MLRTVRPRISNYLKDKKASFTGSESSLGPSPFTSYLDIPSIDELPLYSDVVRETHDLLIHLPVVEDFVIEEKHDRPFVKDAPKPRLVVPASRPTSIKKGSNEIVSLLGELGKGHNLEKFLESHGFPIQGVNMTQLKAALKRQPIQVKGSIKFFLAKSDSLDKRERMR
jgi:hypothetical protein